MINNKHNNNNIMHNASDEVSSLLHSHKHDVNFNKYSGECCCIWCAVFSEWCIVCVVCVVFMNVVV